MRTRSLTLRWLAARDRLLPGLVLLLAAPGCDEGGLPPFIPTDTSPYVDAGRPFLSLCTKDSECASAHCLTLGSVQRCSQTCDASSKCPTGWSCAAGSYCTCTYRGLQPTLCNTDGDCDGKLDRTPRTERCNGEDDDCNGVIDDIAAGARGAGKFFLDADGDKYGDSNTSAWFCLGRVKAGYAKVGGDCDDTRKETNPGQEEICGDVYDNDCDGSKEDPDVCGLTPPVVADVTAGYKSGVLETCGKGPGTLDPDLDLYAILAKQDITLVKYTLSLVGVPATATCASYVLGLGAVKSSPTFIYIYRPGVTACGSLPSLAAYSKGTDITATTKAVVAFFPGDPKTGTDGSVSFTIPKSEIYPDLPSPTYRLKACTNAVADAVKDLSACATDSCETPVHR
jgi:hypothetical protein